jgi:hypothetical protein
LLQKIGYRNCDGQGPRTPLGFADGTEFRPEPPASDKNRLPGSRRLTPDASRTAVRDGKLSFALAPFAGSAAAPNWKHGRSGIFRRASPARVPVLNCAFRADSGRTSITRRTTAYANSGHSDGVGNGQIDISLIGRGPAHDGLTYFAPCEQRRHGGAACAGVALRQSSSLLYATEIG